MPDRDGRPAVLILGGTTEGLALAEAMTRAFGERLRLVSSLAGVTRPLRLPPGEVRSGPFGGVDGLVAYLRDEAIDAVIDATHPFAATMSRHARLASEAMGIRRLVLARPMWRQDPADRWTLVADMAEAARRLPILGRRAFLTVGARDLQAFAGMEEAWFLVRLPTAPPDPVPLVHYAVVVGGGGEDEALMAEHRIDVLVTRASGGRATEAKIGAARRLGLPVLMLRRPPPEPGATVDTIAAALAWFAQKPSPPSSGGRGLGEGGAEAPKMVPPAPPPHPGPLPLEGERE
ncbi:MAG: cobalt-precorrin-6A reductase [Alphaproteobacteria bacterium]